MGNIGKQEALFELWYRVYQKAVQYKIFVNRTHGFSINAMIWGAGKDTKDMIRTGDYDLPAGEISIYYCYNVNL